MEHARGKWLLFLDGDEVIRDTEFDSTLAHLKELSDPPVAMVRETLLLPGSRTLTFFTPRLFLREAGIRCVYPVHEQPDYPGKAMSSNLRIEHLGYQDPAQLEAKERRNLALAKTMPPDHPHGIHCRARSAMALKDWPEVLEAAEQLVALDASSILTVEGCILGGAAAYNLQRFDDTERFVARGKQLAPNSPDLRYLEMLCVSSRYIEAFDAAGDCGSVLSCMGSCEGDLTCNQDCLEVASPEAAEAWHAYASCVPGGQLIEDLGIGNYCQGSDRNPSKGCPEVKCAEEIHMCWNYGINASCGQVLKCVEFCFASSAPWWSKCHQECGLMGTAEAYEKWLALAKCVWEHYVDWSNLWDAYGNDGATLTPCGDVLAQCEYQVWDCPQMMTCYFKCGLGPFDPLCAAVCPLGDNIEAQTLFDAALGCVLTQCEDEQTESCFFDAFSGACEAPVTDCYASAIEPNGR